MLRVKWSIVLVLLVIVEPCFADERELVQGVWKLISLEVETQSTGQKEFPMGEKPTGYATFTTDGRAFFILTAEGRKPAKTDLERAALLDSLVAYTGTYRLEGDKWITKVEVAWNPEWVGTEQARFFKIDGDRLQVITLWQIIPNWPHKGLTRSILMFERSK